MSDVVDLEAGRSRLGHKLKDERAARLKEALRAARETPPTQDESARKLLAVFKRKPSPKR
jgi:hypothetical protein